MIRCQPEMRGQPLQPAVWSSPNESYHQSPRYLDIRNLSPHSRKHHNIKPQIPNYLPHHGIGNATEAPMFGYHLPQYDLAPNGMAMLPGSTSIAAAVPLQFRYIDYDHTQQPHDRLNIHLSAPSPHLDPAPVNGSFTQHVSPESEMKPERDTQSLPDNKANLERMRHERELVFQKAASELDQARHVTGPSAPTNKAWEDAWEVLRESMTKM